MKQIVDIFGSTLASTVRSWRGLSASKRVVQPEQALILFDREGSAECRIVREVLTELNLDVTIAPCPLGGNNLNVLKQESGSNVVPTLFDSNTDESRSGAEDIVAYLFKQYIDSEPSKKPLGSFINKSSANLASLIRLNAGINAKPALSVEKPLTLYSFESSPYSRPVRELLCELELPYKLINLGKQQWSDMGPAKARFSLGPYRPIKNTKRDEFFKAHGNVQVPFLVDPNTEVELFESKDILEYLRKTYQLESSA